MAVRSVARADAGRSNGSSRGSTTRVVSSRAGNVMSTTSWACCISPAPESSSGIYEMTSSLLAGRLFFERDPAASLLLHDLIGLSHVRDTKDNRRVPGSFQDAAVGVLDVDLMVGELAGQFSKSAGAVREVRADY